jgi:exosortase A
MTLAWPAPQAVTAAHTAWRRHLIALGLVWAGLLGLFHADAADMAAIWWNASTFNHCLLILPIIAWLVWQRAPGLRELAPSAWMPGLVWLGLGAFGWLLGEAGGVGLARHAGLVLMLQGAAIACLGKSISRALAFPIFYALFLVPAGEELVPGLQLVTADIVIALLGLAGVPAHIEGVFITTPVGLFEVAEACAGAKFLIAMAAFGALAANVCFRSWRRRIAFMAVSLVVPVLANGVRAWATIYVAELTGNIEFAAGMDHVVYGGIFFAIVIALILALSWRFFDRAVADPWFDPADLAESSGRAPLPFAAIAALALAALPVVWASAVSAGGQRDLPTVIAFPDVPGWQRVEARDSVSWRPNFTGADRFDMTRYRDAQGREVDLAIAIFTHQDEGRELVGFGQGAVPPGSAWTRLSAAPAPPGGRAERIASHGLVREVASFYRVGSIVTGSGMKVKLETMKVRLFGGPQRAVAVLVSAPVPAGGVSPRPAIDDFLTALGPVAPLADRMAGLD